jgi:hypothetical protein
VSARRKTWLVKRRGRGWAVQRIDAVAASSMHDAREDAIARGIELTQRASGTLKVKDDRGRVEQEFSFER